MRRVPYAPPWPPGSTGNTPRPPSIAPRPPPLPPRCVRCAAVYLFSHQWSGLTPVHANAPLLAHRPAPPLPPPANGTQVVLSETSAGASRDSPSYTKWLTPVIAFLFMMGVISLIVYIYKASLCTPPFHRSPGSLLYRTSPLAAYINMCCELPYPRCSTRRPLSCFRRNAVWLVLDAARGAVGWAARACARGRRRADLRQRAGRASRASLRGASIVSCKQPAHVKLQTSQPWPGRAPPCAFLCCAEHLRAPASVALYSVMCILH